ncbi:MAG: MmcQ/YjbR family DNA-binding protein [Litorimonas sp.]
MNLSSYNTFCGSLPQTEHVVQWRGMDVWKVGGKLFAMARETDGQVFITFKATEIGYEIMRDMEGLRPAPYMASRGMKWIQHYAEPGLPDTELAEHIELSYHMAIERITQKKRFELGLDARI